jgi:signal transduction histidine kinase/CheY-like chemotaxis protein
VKKIILIAFVLIMLTTTGCAGENSPAQSVVWFDSFLDIPYITNEQISDIENLQQNRTHFVYGMLQNDDAFYDRCGECIIGFTYYFTNWLSGLFDIPFEAVIFDELPELVAAINAGYVDFTGQLPHTVAANLGFATTSPVSKRSVAVVRPQRGARPLHIIEQERPLQLGFETGAALHNVLRNNEVFEYFYSFFFDTPQEAAEKLKSGEIDAFFGDGVISLSIDFPGFNVQPLYPFMFGYSSFSTPHEELFSVIQVVQLALENGGMSILAELYSVGKADAARHRMELLLTDEEQAFIAANPVIPIAAHGLSYPVSFYSTWENEFQGIAIDILRDIETLTGLIFDIVSGTDLGTSALSQMLTNGEVYLAAGVFREDIREASHAYILTEGFFSESYVLLSRADKPIIGVNEVLYYQVGIVNQSIYENMFFEMFPNHMQLIRIATHDDALDALEAREIDLLFTSHRALIRATHWLERPDFRVNIELNETYYVSFAVYENAELLVSIMNKALTIVDINSTAEAWMGRTFDFSLRLLQAQRPWLIGSVVMLVMILILLCIVFLVNRRVAISERRRLAEKNQAEIAKESNRAKSRFLARMSHEIRTPITSVLGVAEIELQSPTLAPQMENSFMKIHTAANTLLGIVNDVLDLSKIEAGKMELFVDEYDVASMISDIAQLQLDHISNKNIIFILKIGENMPTHLNGDVLRIQQVMTNLLSNAFKYTEKGAITLIWGYDGKNLTISLTDTGMGMTPDQLKILRHSEYTRFHEQENRSISGTGLGMPIVLNLLGFMDGKIEIKSEVNKGTQIEIRIPQKAKNADKIDKETIDRLQNFDKSMTTAGRKKFEFVPEPMPYGKVLVVDDLDANLYVARGLMAFYDLQVETCMSGTEAIQKVENGATYDIIFLDYMMPELNGLETLNILREKGYTQPIVALTANALIGQAEQFMKDGFDGFVSKPIQTKSLNTVLRKFVRDKQPAEVVTQAVKPATTALDILEKLEPLLATRSPKCLEHIEELRTFPQMAVLIKQIEGFKFADALASLKTLKTII